MLKTRSASPWAGVERTKCSVADFARLFLSHPPPTIPSMAQLFVEGWAPEYGNPVETDESVVDRDSVDETVEVETRWQPINGVDDGIESVTFVDGVRRIDARLTIDEPDGPVPGICGSYGVGAVRWDRTVPRSEVTVSRIERLAVFGHGKGMPVPVAGPQLAYRTASVADEDPRALIQYFHGAMRKAEAVLSEELAQAGQFVIADGPINDLSATEKVGYIKTHRAPYLSQARSPIIGRLETGQRTPLFLIGASGAYPRYSWYLRLARLLGGHSWSGIVRGEVSSHLTIEDARCIADRTTAILPKVASEAHVDPRAPQNLVPIAALERELRHRLGDPGFVVRALRSAVASLSTVGGAE